MLTRFARHAAVGAALAAVAGIAAASTLGAWHTPAGRAYVEILENRPVLSGDLGEVVVVATRETPASGAR